MEHNSLPILTLYDQTQLDYTYMEHLLDHSQKYGLELSSYKGEIESFQQKCAVWIVEQEESIYPQFARLLDALMELLELQEREVLILIKEKEKID